jgi:dephospho-CoA kinase
MVVGVSGRYCAGKSEVSGMLVAEGYERVDVDSYGHEALASEANRVVNVFGERILRENGEIDRRKLGEIVFGDEDARRRLEEIVHPIMRERVEARAAEGRSRGERLVIDAALLFYMELHTACDRVIWVDAPFLVRLWRALKRDSLSLPRLLSRFRAQRALTPQPYMHDVDIRRVNNWGSRARLYRQVAEVPGVLPKR